MSAGKGDKWRPTDKAKYDACPYWANTKKRKGINIHNEKPNNDSPKPQMPQSIEA